MKNKLSQLPIDILLVVKNNPVEILLGFTYFVMAVISETDYATLPSEIFVMSPLLIPLSFILNKCCERFPYRILYYLSYFLVYIFLHFIPTRFIDSSGFFYALLITGILFLSYRFYKENVAFAREAISTLNNFFAGILVAIVFYLLVLGIYYSVAYIFNIEFLKSSNFYSYIFFFVLFLVGPFAFLFFDKFSVTTRLESSGIFTVLMNFLLSPALLIYTAILYLYFIKIIVLWELPKGGVAYMIFAFVLLVASGKISQHILNKRLYNWFYDRFSYISLPLLAMFWVGVVYRLNEYGVTENRIYLVVAGIVITIFALFFLFRKTSHYVYVSSAAILLFSVFTFVPGLTARDLDEKYRRKNEKVKDSQIFSRDRYHFYLNTGCQVDISGYTKMIRLSGNALEKKNEILYQVELDTQSGELFLYAGKDTFSLININEQLQQSASRHGVNLEDSLNKSALKPCVEELNLIRTEKAQIHIDHIILVWEKAYKVEFLGVDWLTLKE